MHKFLTVVGYTYRQITRGRSFQAGTLLMLIMVALLVSSPALIRTFSSQTPGVVAVMDEATTQAPVSVTALRRSVDPSVRWVLTQAKAVSHYRTALAKGANGVVGVIVIRKAATGAPAIISYARAQNPGYLAPLGAYLQSVYTQNALRQVGLTPVQEKSVLAPVTLSQVTLQTSHPERFAPTYALEMLLYMFVLLYGMNILMAVAAEKNSRVQEILITSVHPDTLMYGKLVGTCLVGLTQYPLLLLTAYAVYRGTATNSGGFDPFSHLSPGMLGLFVLFFILGYFLYASLYAAVASLVSRVEEVGPLAQPVTMLFVLSFMLSLFALQMPNSSWVAVLSFIPLFTPTVMFARIGMTSVPDWQVAISLVVLAAATALSAFVSAKIYRVGVMLYGKRPSLRQVFKLLRQH